MKKNRWLNVLKKSKNKKTLIILLLVVICLFFSLLILVPTRDTPLGYPEFSKETSPELQELTNRKFKTFAELATYFRKISNTKGALYGFQVLRYATLPPRTDLHLLAHTVGDILYKQQGTEGMKYCTDEFRNACSHSIVVGTLLEKGENSLSLFSKICEKAPGGTGAYQMCFHGLGHGILSYTNYDMEKAVKLCRKTGTNEHQYREYRECVGGTVMEIVGGGDHDKATYQKMVGKYIKKEDPLSPCDTDIIPADAKYLCYTYITPNMMVQAGASLANPNPKLFPKAFSFCDKVSIYDDKNRDACYGGFGKEFPALANSRDIRSVDKMNKKQLEKVNEWCKLAGVKDGINSCVKAALQSLFWGGETNPNISYEFCGMQDEPFKRSCYETLAGAINAYIKEPIRKKSLCDRLPKVNQTRCYNG